MEGCKGNNGVAKGAKRQMGSETQRRKAKKRLTLSEHLALREKASKEAESQADARLYSAEDLRRLDALAVCNCPACVERRQASMRRP